MAAAQFLLIEPAMIARRISGDAAPWTAHRFVPRCALVVAMAACAPDSSGDLDTGPTPNNDAGAAGSDDSGPPLLDGENDAGGSEPDVDVIDEVTYDITFCTTTSGSEMRLDYYPATVGSGPFPLVVVVHGGGFARGDKGTAEGLRAQPGMNEAGISVMSINYRLTGELQGGAALPKMAGDVKCAIRYARRNASSLNIDPERIGITGSSAGGYLANLTAVVTEQWDDRDYVDPHDDYSSAVRSLVDWYGASDVTYEFAGFPSILRASLLGSFDPDEETLILASPAHQVSVADPPALIMNGVDDGVIPPEQAQVFYDAFVRAGATAELVLVENAMHGFIPTDRTESSPTMEEIVQMTIDWFETTLSR